MCLSGYQGQMSGPEESDGGLSLPRLSFSNETSPRKLAQDKSASRVGRNLSLVFSDGAKDSSSDEEKRKSCGGGEFSGLSGMTAEISRLSVENAR